MMNFHHLAPEVPDSLLIEHGYHPFSKCNKKGSPDEDGVWARDEMVFQGKETELELAFDEWVLEKNMDCARAKSITRSVEWRPLV